MAAIPIVGCDSDDDSGALDLDSGTREVHTRDAAVRAATDAGDAAVAPHYDAGPRDAGSLDVCGPPDAGPLPPATLLALDDYCKRFGCPSALGSALDDVADVDGGNCYVWLISGCGIDSIQSSDGWKMESWNFDRSGRLIGAEYSDVPFVQPCGVEHFQAGVQHATCPSESMQFLCTWEGDGGG